MNENFKYTVLIVGAGSIASEYDSPASKNVLTHSHAIQLCSEHLQLIGFYDINIEKAQSAAKKWNTLWFSKIVAADIIVICTPDNVHLQSIREAVNVNPKLIILEKPIAGRLNEAKEILHLVKGIPTVVNFSRRFVNEFYDIKKTICLSSKFITGNGIYSKGFVHNGSHMVDLLRLLIGEIREIKRINEGDESAIVYFENGEKFFMFGLSSNVKYTVFELDLLFEDYRIRIIDSGRIAIVYQNIESRIYSGYRELLPQNKLILNANSALTNLYEMVVNYFMNAGILVSSINDAYCEELYII